jgi:O-antigen/teichoic acid export membrane protein
MTKAKTLSGGVIWNLAGQGLPLVVALICIPILIRHLGLERFGLLAFVWMIVGYSSLLDLGIGRALTQGVAERLGNGDHESIPAFVQTGVILLLAFAIVVGLGLSMTSGWIVRWGLKVPASMGHEAIHSIAILAFAVPIVVLGTAFRGVMEAHQRFRDINIVKGAVGAMLYTSPLVVMVWTTNVPMVVASLVMVRLMETLTYIIICTRLEPRILHKISLHPKHMKPLFGFGLWSTVNNLVGTLMTLAYIDRIFIGAILGTGALAFYSTPFDMVVRTLIIPTALMTVIFPVFSSFGHQGNQQAQDLAEKASNLILYVAAPIFLSLVVVASSLLLFWLGPEFAQRSTINLQLFAIGTFAVSLGYVPFAFIQAMGRPDLTAKRHLVEIPFYLVISYTAIHWKGLRGAAYIWLIWSLVDLWLIYGIMDRMYPRKHNLCRTLRSWPVVLFFILAIGLGRLTHPAAQFLGAVVIVMTFLIWGWRYLLTRDDKASLLRPLPGVFARMLMYREEITR